MSAKTSYSARFTKSVLKTLRYNAPKVVHEKTYVYDHTAKLPKGVTGTFLLKNGEMITTDVTRINNDHVNRVTIKNRKTLMGQNVPRVLWDTGTNHIPVEQVIEMAGCEFLIELSTKTVVEDKTPGRKFASLMGDLLSKTDQGIPTQLTGELRANRIVIRPFVTIKKALPVEANVRVQFTYQVKSKNKPKEPAQ